jgi:hypothetical protein
VPREVVEDVRGGRDRIRTQEERQLRLHTGRDEPERERLIAGDVPVRPRRQLRGRHLVLGRKAFGRLAEGIAGLERALVRLGDLRPFRELLLEEVDRALGRTRVEPRHEPEREHVLRALRLAAREAGPFDRLERERRQRHIVHAELVERAVLERVGGVTGLLQVAVVERVAVDDQRPARRQVFEICAQSRGVHRDENLRRVAGGEDVVVGVVDLETGDARQRTGRSADLGWEVGQRREVVAEQRRLAREAAPGQLHAVPGVAGEADDHLFQLLDGLGHRLSRRYSTRP